MDFHAIIFNANEWIGHRAAGAYRIAHVLRKEGWDVEVLEFSAHYKYEKLKAFVDSRITQNTKFVGFSNQFNIWSSGLHAIMKYIKDRYPDIVLIGGSNDGVSWRATQVDYFIQGYAEVAVFKLLKWLFSNGDKPYMIEVDTPAGKRKAIPAMSKYPAFPMKDLSIIYEDRDFIDPCEWLSVELSRGCMFKCNFCSFTVLGVKGDYTASADEFDTSLKRTYDQFGAYKYVVADETVNDRTQKITKFADKVQQMDFDPYFIGFIRADLAVSRGKQEWDELARMNFIGQYYGIESFNHSSAKSIGKGMLPEKLQNGLIEMKEYYNKVMPFFRGEISLIAGLPHETRETLHQTADWLQENWKGEAVKMWRLSIPKGNSLNRGSHFTNNYEKYGYRKIKIDGGQNRDYFENTLNGDEIEWENDIMNYIEADQIKKEIDQRIETSDFSLGVFELGLVMETTVEKALKYDPFPVIVRGPMRDEIKHKRGDALIDNYFYKKMSI